MRTFINGMMVGMTCLAILTIHNNYSWSHDVPNDGYSALPLTVEYYISTEPDHNFLDEVPIPRPKPKGYTITERKNMDTLIAKYQ